MQYKFFTSSKAAWQAMFEAIKFAKESVYLEMYIFQDDMDRFNFIDLLKEKAREGLRVRIVLDSFGSVNLSKSAISELRENGVELFFMSYFLHRTHKKILIIDNTIAFIGGVNFHQSAELWNDLVVKIKGTLVKFIIRSFAKDYALCGGTDPIILNQKKKIIFNKTHAWLVEHFPIGKKFRLKKIYKKHLNQAKENVILVTPYFIPKRWLRALLHQTVLRGVRVDVLVPKKTDSFIIDRVNHFYMYKLSKLGINFYLEPQMNHAKVMIIDSKEGIVGSHNLDFLSFDLNFEVGVFLKDSNAVHKLLNIVDEWKKNTTFFDFKTYKPIWLDYILSPLIKLFARIF